MTINPPIFKKGDLVIVSPQSYPLQRWRGRILRRTKNGYSVRYETAGVPFNTVFSQRELSPA